MNKGKIKRFVKSKEDGTLGIDKGYMINSIVIKAIDHWKIEDSLKKVYPDYNPGETAVYLYGKKQDINIERAQNIIGALRTNLERIKKDINEKDKLEDTGINIDSLYKDEDARVYRNTRTDEIIAIQEWYVDAFNLDKKNLSKVEILGSDDREPVIFYNTVSETIDCVILPIRHTIAEKKSIKRDNAKFVIDNFKEE